MIKTLNNWSVVYGDVDPYQPPELLRKYLHGELECGKTVNTSHIVSVNHDVVTTNSGTEYKLLEPRPDYLEYLKDNDIELPTKDYPIRTK